MILSNFGFGSGGGGASGDISGVGTAPKMPKFTAEKTIADSQVSDNGTTVFIGASATSEKALFELNSTTQGVLLPRLTTAQINAITVGATTNSLMLYSTTANRFRYYEHVGGVWETIALLSDLSPYLKLDGTTPMTGDLDMTTNAVAVKTTKIETLVGRLDWLAGLDSLIHDFTSWVGGGGASHTQTWRAKSGVVAHLDDIPKHSYMFAASDETSDLGADATTSVYTDYIAVPITPTSVMINVNTAPTGAKIIVDIKKNGTSIFSTLISIDTAENTSLTASVPYVLNGTEAFVQGDKIECFITQVGSTIAGAGLKVKLIA